MLKKFMIEKIDHKQLSDNTGNIVFHLIDETGECRTVHASTFLDENQQPTGITSNSIRELPLVESLFSNRDKSIVEVEFDYFNHIYERDDNQTIDQATYDAVMKRQNENKFTRRIMDFFKNS